MFSIHEDDSTNNNAAEKIIASIGISLNDKSAPDLKGYTKFGILEEENELKEEKFRLLILQISYLSIALNFVFSVVGIVLFCIKWSPASLAFGADCALDLLSSIVLVWRYQGSKGYLFSIFRERMACLILGFLFILASVIVICWSFSSLFTFQTPEWYLPLFVISIFGTISCMSLFFIKLWLYRKINGKAVLIDAINSLLGGLMGLVVIISDTIYRINKDIWFLDPVISIFLAIALFIYGIKIIHEHRKVEEVD